jgi:hypothetical protein
MNSCLNLNARSFANTQRPAISGAITQKQKFGASGYHDNAMYMVWHNHKSISLNLFSNLGRFQPSILRNPANLRQLRLAVNNPTQEALAAAGENRDEIAAGRGVVIPAEAC